MIQPWVDTRAVSSDQNPEQDREELRALSVRVAQACGRLSIRRLARLTGMNAESVRRYRRGDKPSALFLLRLCGVLHLSAEWVLTGRGRPEAAGDQSAPPHNRRSASS